MDRPWASRANREVAAKHFKVLRAREEIVRLNVEIRRLHRWIDDEDRQLFATVRALQETDKPLATAVSAYAQARHRVNNVHRRRLNTLYRLKGFTGARTQVINTDVDASEAEGTPLDILADEDDTLNDEMQRLADCLENMHS